MGGPIEVGTQAEPPGWPGGVAAGLGPGCLFCHLGRDTAGNRQGEVGLALDPLPPATERAGDRIGEVLRMPQGSEVVHHRGDLGAPRPSLRDRGPWEGFVPRPIQQDQQVSWSKLDSSRARRGAECRLPVPPLAIERTHTAQHREQSQATQQRAPLAAPAVGPVANAALLLGNFQAGMSHKATRRVMDHGLTGHTQFGGDAGGEIDQVPDHPGNAGVQTLAGGRGAVEKDSPGGGRTPVGAARLRKRSTAVVLDKHPVRRTLVGRHQGVLAAVTRGRAANRRSHWRARRNLSASHSVPC